MVSSPVTSQNEISWATPSILDRHQTVLYCLTTANSSPAASAAVSSRSNTRAGARRSFRSMRSIRIIFFSDRPQTNGPPRQPTGRLTPDDASTANEIYLRRAIDEDSHMARRWLAYPHHDSGRKIGQIPLDMSWLSFALTDPCPKSLTSERTSQEFFQPDSSFSPDPQKSGQITNGTVDNSACPAPARLCNSRPTALKFADF